MPITPDELRLVLHHLEAAEESLRLAVHCGTDEYGKPQHIDQLWMQTRSLRLHLVRFRALAYQGKT